jgi:hypothetical protein
MDMTGVFSELERKVQHTDAVAPHPHLPQRTPEIFKRFSTVGDPEVVHEREYFHLHFFDP